MAQQKNPPKGPRLGFPVRTFRLTPEVEAALHQLRRTASDFLGRSISHSAIVRALIRQAAQQDPTADDALFRLVEQEVKSGMMRGRKK